MNQVVKHSSGAPRRFERVAEQLVAQVIFERSRFGRHAHEGKRATVERLLERLSYRRASERRRRRVR